MKRKNSKILQKSAAKKNLENNMCKTLQNDAKKMDALRV